MARFLRSTYWTTIRFLIATALMTNLCFASETYFTAAGMAQQYPEEETEWGLSLRTHTTFLQGHKGYFDIVAPGDSLFAATYSGGFTRRWGSAKFFEASIGAGYGLVAGATIVGLFGYGVKLSGKVSLFFPIYYRTGGLGGLEYAPYIGWVF